MFARVTARSVVVPLETTVDVPGQANVVTSGVPVAAKDVDEALADAMHGGFLSQASGHTSSTRLGAN